MVPVSYPYEATPAGAMARVCPLDEINFVPTTVPSGLTSRARTRARFKQELEVRLNRAISALKQLWLGQLTDQLLGDPLLTMPPGPITERGQVIISYLREKLAVP